MSTKPGSHSQAPISAMKLSRNEFSKGNEYVQTNSTTSRSSSHTQIVRRSRPLKICSATDGHGVVLEEWVSQEPVQVLAKLSISPEDFPLLDAIWGHNEFELAWLAETIKICSGAVKEFNELRSGYSLTFPGGDEWATRLSGLCHLQQTFCPFLVFKLIRGSSNGPIYLKATGPDGTKQLIRSMLGMYS